jgi:protocatechuate 3,4-dioxygenase beta subunit
VFLYPIPIPDGVRLSQTVTDKNGEYSFSGLPPGDYRVGVHNADYFPLPESFHLTTFSVGAGERRGGIDILMSRGGVLSGRMLDASGRPFTDAFVGALRVTTVRELEKMSPSLSTARTTARGEFRVSGLRPGKYVLVANQTSGGGTGVADSITYYPGTGRLSAATELAIAGQETITDLAFTMILPQTFEVTGHAVDRFGNPVAGALISLDTTWPLFGGPKGSRYTDTEGRFTISRVAPGDYKLSVTPPGIKPQPFTRKTPYLTVSVVDENLSGLNVLVPLP